MKKFVIQLLAGMIGIVLLQATGMDRYFIGMFNFAIILIVGELYDKR